MIEVRGRRHHRGVVDVTRNGAHEVSRVGALHIEAVRRHAREVGIGRRVDCHRVHDQAVIGVHHHSRRVVVAGHRVTAPLLLVAEAVTVFIVDAIAVAVEVIGQRIGAVATVDGGVHVVVAGQLLRASHAAEVAGAVIERGRHVVVAGSSIRAARAAGEVTRAIINRGRLIIVARGFVGAPHTACVFTRAIIVRRIGIVVARRFIRTTDGFVLITDSIAIRIVDAISIAIKDGVSRVFTRSVVDGGGSVIVARHRIRTSVDTRTTENISFPEVNAAIPFREDLGIELTTEVSRRSELTSQHFQIRSSDSIGITIQGIPSTTDDVVDDNAFTGHTSTRVEVGEPWIACRLDCGHIGFPRQGIRSAGQANGDPTVVGQIRVDWEQQAIDAVRHPGSQRSVVEIRRGVHIGRIHRVTGDGTEEIILVGHGHEDLVTAVTGQVSGSECTDEDADVFGNGLHF